MKIIPGFRKILKIVFAKIPIETFERVLTFSVLRERFAALAEAKSFQNRELLWDYAIKEQIQPDEKIIYVEFGVHKGYSISYFSKRNNNPLSNFVGLDSFEGLPEDWGTMPKGTFDTKGNLPTVEDTRIKFVKGRFQNTSVELLNILSQTDGKLIVHFDADLYSSTLFALTQMDTIKTHYLAIFDEFTGHEARALYNYLQAFSAEVSFLGKTEAIDGYPLQILARIVPNGSFPS